MDERDRDQIAAYALGALDESERRELAARLDSSPELREQLAEFQVIAGLLPLAAGDAPAPDRLKARIIAAAWQDVVAAQEPRPSADPARGGPVAGQPRSRRSERAF